jgi:aerobic carbon-monoxide dehydrogenase large subunit
MKQALVTKQKFLGARVKSTSAPRVLLARTSYVDDIKLPEMVYLSFTRSASPHSKIVGIDLKDALEGDGVIEAITGEDIAGKIQPFPILASPNGVRPFRKLPIAIKKVRYVGEIVAAIVGRSRPIAEDGAESVRVEYEAKDPVVNLEDALKVNSPLVIDEWGTNEAYFREIKAGNADQAFEKADFILKERFKIQRQYGSPMEPRGVIAAYDPATDYLTLYTSTQWPHIVRTVLSRMLGIGEHKIRVIAPDVGGGFGNKQDVYPEEIIAAYLARKIRRPIKWIASRSEDTLSTVHARDQVHNVEFAVSRDGALLGIRDEILADLGAFHTMSIGPQLVTIGTLPGAYRIKNWHIKLRCVVTNKTPVGAYRGFGASESNFVLERSVDLIARELKLDRAKIRLKNFIQASEFPYRTALGTEYDSGNYTDCLRQGLKIAEYESFKERQMELRKQGRLVGLGISFVVESTGIGSSREMEKDGFKVYAGYDNATVRVERSGSITVLTGLSPHGQGLDTTLAQICADEFGVNVEDVRLNWGDTMTSPYGFGTWGSRSAITGSTAMKMSIDKVKEKAKRIAAHFLKAKKEDIEFEDGRFYVRRYSRKTLSLREVAEIAYKASDLPDGMEPGLSATSFYDPPSPSYAYGVHLPIVEVDLDSGKVILQRYIVVHDCGTMINPTIVEGQLQGGIAQGIGGSLLEELRYSSEGQLLAGNFMDYLLPTAGDITDIEIHHSETPSTVNPFGIKGVGEGGAIAPPAAIASAIENALNHLGVKITETPITPEKVVGLIKHSAPVRNRN